MADSTFDIVSKVDKMEADNAVNQAQKELLTRYDFKGVGASVEWSGEKLLLKASAEDRLDALLRTGLQQQLLAAPLDGCADAFEVVPGQEFFLRLVDGVVRLHLVDLAHDVERRVCHASSLRRSG